jgi:hypothetical protein
MQIPRQRPQVRHQMPSPSDRPARALTHQEAAHVRRRQPLKLKPIRTLPKEQPRRPLILNDRASRQAALDHQIVAIALEQFLQLTVRDTGHQLRRGPDLTQILKRQHHRSR